MNEETADTALRGDARHERKMLTGLRGNVWPRCRLAALFNTLNLVERTFVTIFVPKIKRQEGNHPRGTLLLCGETQRHRLAE